MMLINVSGSDGHLAKRIFFMRNGHPDKAKKNLQIQLKEKHSKFDLQESDFFHFTFVSLNFCEK